MTAFVALLRAVNVGGRKVEMGKLRKVAQDLGHTSVQTYMASGNLVFWAHGSPSHVRGELEAAIAQTFGMEVPVILRTNTQWQRYAKSCPFAASTQARPGMVYLALSHKDPQPGAAEAIEARGQAGEAAKVVGDALWVDYPEGMGRSKVTPALVDKAVGGPTTARNWNTVVAIAGLLAMTKASSGQPALRGA